MTPTQTTPTPGNAVAIEAARDVAAYLDDLHSDISRLLSAIAADDHYVLKLTTSRQRGLGFLTPAGEDAIDTGLRAERTERARRHATAHTLLRETTHAGHGYTAAPGDIGAINVHAHTTTALHQLIRTAISHLADAGICSLHTPPRHHAGTTELAGHLRRLAMDVHDPATLETISSELTATADKIRVLIDGDPKTFLPGTCPHCDRVTLVVHFDEHLVHCGRERTHPRRAGRHYQPCVCPDPLCHCKTDALTPRHTWSLTNPRSYLPLQRHLNRDSLDRRSTT